VHLEPAHTLDLYQWPQSEKPKGVMIDEEKKWELKKLLKKRMYWKERSITTEYLTWWLEYESEFDSWINVKDLEHTEELIRLYEEENAIVVNFSHHAVSVNFTITLNFKNKQSSVFCCVWTTNIFLFLAIKTNIFS